MEGEFMPPTEPGEYGSWIVTEETRIMRFEIIAAAPLFSGYCYV
jgi:hypothetical protein